MTTIKSNQSCGVTVNEPKEPSVSELIIKELIELNDSLRKISIRVEEEKKKIFGVDAPNPSECCEKAQEPSGILQRISFQIEIAKRNASYIQTDLKRFDDL